MTEPRTDFPVPMAPPRPEEQPSEPDPETGKPVQKPQPLPLKVWLSLLRQRAILLLRYLFRLPIDRIREEQSERNTATLFENQKYLLQVLTTQQKVIGQMNLRLQHYEQHIPRMRDLRREFDREQQKPTDPDLANGILTNGNGKIELLR